MMQAIGRARGVNRTNENPVDVDIVADVCLPITVNGVSLSFWTKRTALMEAGRTRSVVLMSPARAASRMFVELAKQRS